ncbi:hypothetical protein QFC19_001395 [Naganishia cerealis]|uniref:Uncharacterized protein n=1 Tax=Naganishia cerealis TaxID=610337 RepID=A0ACC2WHH9_9TREE|nr:hypothetical protein QFC19_001395 [Naganishia cerealis]
MHLNEDERSEQCGTLPSDEQSEVGGTSYGDTGSANTDPKGKVEQESEFSSTADKAMSKGGSSLGDGVSQQFSKALQPDEDQTIVFGAGFRSNIFVVDKGQTSLLDFVHPKPTKPGTDWDSTPMEVSSAIQRCIIPPNQLGIGPVQGEAMVVVPRVLGQEGG